VCSIDVHATLAHTFTHPLPLDRSIIVASVVVVVVVVVVATLYYWSNAL
jgi:hypothetical protein